MGRRVSKPKHEKTGLKGPESLYTPLGQEDYELYEESRYYINRGSTGDGWVLLGCLVILGIFIVYSLFTRS
jgi:hypothetical protein